MRQKLLGKEHEFWLKKNYSCYENPVLAEKLTEMVRISNEKEHSELVRMLPCLADQELIDKVSSRILFLRTPATITADYVKKAARRLNCPRKTLEVVSTARSRSAKTRHISRWVKMAVEVDKPVAWFRTLKLRKTYVAKFSTMKKMKNFLEYLSAWNRDEGMPNNIFLHAEPFKDERIVCVRAKVYINKNEL